ncbi:MAG: transglycosylase domain-containing protein [Oscillospiraceae bacterium]
MNNPEEKKQGKPKRKKSFWKTIGRTILTLMMICIITGSIVASVLTVYVLKSIETEEEISLENVKYNYTTILYAPNAQTGEYEEFQRLAASENRIWVNYDKMSPYLSMAAISIEDKRFMKHHGVDWRRTIAAVVNQFIPFSSSEFGGSTITQQLIKNITGDDQYRVDRKVREIFRAINLDKNYSKEQILEAYLNTISLGNNTNGVEAAANLYFGKKAIDLTIAESASIVSITQNPSKWNPFVYPENNKKRRENVIEQMRLQKLITEEQYETAMAEKLEFKTEENKLRIETTQNWFVDHVLDEVINDLVTEKNFTKIYATKQVYNGGYRIYMTMDKDIQKYVDEQFINMDNFPAVYNKEYPEGSFVLMDLNGKILALSGSNREKVGARLFNRATRAIRQPGSAIKPLASYTPAMEKNLITWSTIIEDSPVTINSGGQDIQWPQNHYRSYVGPVTVDYAIRRSVNTIPVKLVSMLTPDVSFDFLRDKLKFQNLADQEYIGGNVYGDRNLPGMALGGLTNGVTPLELTGGYQIFGNGGTFTKPYAYTKVLDSEGNVVLEKDITPIRVISGETSAVMCKLLQRVTTGPLATGTTAKFSQIPVAGKTGTSDKDQNQWFVGVTPYYVASVWLGYDNPETIKYGYYPPPIIWKNMMGPLHKDLEVKDFNYGDNIVKATYCLKTGGLATSDCTEVDVGWFKRSNIPGSCPGHDIVDEEIAISEDENMESDSSIPDEIEERVDREPKYDE